MYDDEDDSDVTFNIQYYGDNHTEHKYIFVGLDLVLVIFLTFFLAFK